MADDTNTAEREAAEQWLRDRYGAYRGHFAWRELEEAFLAGRASLAASAGSEPVAWRLRNTAFRSEVYEYFKTKYLAECRQKQFNASVDDGGLHDLTPLYTHHSPPEGMAGWTKASEQLPPCGDDQDFIGINTAGFAGVFNAVRVIDGNTYCLMETAEESVSIMSDLDIWKPFIRPPIPASEAKEAIR